MKNPWEGGTFELQEGTRTIETKGQHEVEDWVVSLLNAGKIPTVIYFLENSPLLAFRITSNTSYRELKDFLNLIDREWSVEHP